MIRQIGKIDTQSIVLEMPKSYLGHEVEILAFPLDEKESKSEPSNADKPLSHAGILKDSRNFRGDIVSWQRSERDAWR